MEGGEAVPSLAQSDGDVTTAAHTTELSAAVEMVAEVAAPADDRGGSFAAVRTEVVEVPEVRRRVTIVEPDVTDDDNALATRPRGSRGSGGDSVGDEERRGDVSSNTVNSDGSSADSDDTSVGGSNVADKDAGGDSDDDDGADGVSVHSEDNIAVHERRASKTRLSADDSSALRARSLSPRSASAGNPTSFLQSLAADSQLLRLRRASQNAVYEPGDPGSRMHDLAMGLVDGVHTRSRWNLQLYHGYDMHAPGVSLSQLRRQGKLGRGGPGGAAARLGDRFVTRRVNNLRTIMQERLRLPSPVFAHRVRRDEAERSASPVRPQRSFVQAQELLHKQRLQPAGKGGVQAADAAPSKGKRRKGSASPTLKAWGSSKRLYAPAAVKGIQQQPVRRLSVNLPSLKETGFLKPAAAAVNGAVAAAVARGDPKVDAASRGLPPALATAAPPPVMPRGPSLSSIPAMPAVRKPLAKSPTEKSPRTVERLEREKRQLLHDDWAALEAARRHELSNDAVALA